MASLSLSLTPDKRQPPRGDKMVFGDPLKVGKEAERLSRLMRLWRVLSRLPSDSREAHLNRIQGVWEDVHKQLSEGTKGAIECGLAKLDKRVAAIYRSELESSEIPVATQVRRFVKDAGFLPVCPAHSSARGLNGPTFLVKYPSKNHLRSYVIKWVKEWEQSSNQIYQAFSHCFSDDDYSWGFSVPHSALLDFDQGTFEFAKGQVVDDISPKYLKKLQEDFLRFAQSYNSELEPATNKICLMENVRGSNLLDFSFTKYALLSPQQRVKFFERLGRMAMLDLILGNVDRLVQLDPMAREVRVKTDIKVGIDGEVELTIRAQDEEEVFAFDRFGETNLGNVMVSFNDGDEDFDLYAIDNGIHEDLVLDDQCKQKYLVFLENLFSDPRHIELLTRNMIESFESALRSQVDEIDLSTIPDLSESSGGKKKLEIIRERLEPLFHDLRTIAPRAFASGLKNTADGMQRKLNGIWNDTPRALALRSYLHRTSPQLLEAIEERFQVLQRRIK